MSRFDYDYADGEGVPWGLWQQTVSRALGGRRGQEALAELEAALLDLPDRRLIEGYLANDGDVCAVGAFVAHQRAQEQGIDLAAVIEAMDGGTTDAWETAEAGCAAGLRYSVAWHLAHLNDEEFGGATPEKRYELMLAWVRRAQGKLLDAVA
jgi:hypothetical protein